MLHKNPQSFHRRYSVLLVMLLSTSVSLLSPRPTLAQTSENTLAKKILKETSVQGGLIIHLGCGDGKLTGRTQAQ